MRNASPSSTDTSLLGRVKRWEDEQGWQTFFRIYRPFIHGLAIKSGLNNEEAQEVAQETLIELATRLKNQEYHREQGSFRGWLFRLTHWRITNQFHKRQKAFLSLEEAGINDSGGGGPSELFLDDANQFWEENWRQTLFDAAMDRLRQRMKPKHFQVLDVLVCQGRTPEYAARALHLHRGQVYLIKLRGVVLLRKEIARLEKGAIH